VIDLDSTDAVIAAHLSRPRLGRPGSPWVMANMVSSLDGSVTRAGRSGALAGPADRLVFRAVRSVPDTILVGAATVRAERYHPPSVPAGRDRGPRLAIVSGSLDLDPGLPCLRDARPGERPWILTGADAPVERRAALDGIAEVIDVGPGRVSAVDGLAALAERGAEVVLCEGGPTLLGQLAEHDLIDEWLVTVAGVVVAGPGGRIARLDHEVDQRQVLASAITDGQDLFLAYLRDRT
jgi:riboflavin biosynthesis pyrimidine reductase